MHDEEIHTLEHLRAVATYKGTWVDKRSVAFDVASHPAFESARLWSFPKGEWNVYREKKGYDTLQVREFSVFYKVQLDTAHPKYAPLHHVRYDATRELAMVSGLGGLVALAYWVQRYL